MNTNEIVLPDFFDGTIDDVEGLTPFGHFDDDNSFKIDSKKIVKYITSQMGFPVHQIEITLQQIYTCIESAIMEYAQVLNDFRTREEYFNVLGSSKKDKLSDLFISQNINHIVKLSDSYALHAHVESGFPVYKGFLNIEVGKQVYNFIDEYFQENHPNKKFTIKRVFHTDSPVGLAGRADGWLENFAGFPIMADAGIFTSGYTMLPSSYQISRLQGIKNNRDIRLSHLGFDLIGGNIRLFPRPERSFKLWFEYILDDDIYGIDSSEDENLITSPTDMHFNLYQWGEIAEAYKVWIIKYAIALCNVVMGKNRRKFTSIQYASGDISLDGDALVNEGIAETERLRLELKEKLEGMSYERGMEIKRNIAENQQEILNKIPIPVTRG